MAAPALILQANGAPNNGPTYQLIRSNIFDNVGGPTAGIVLPCDRAMRLYMHRATARGREEWWSKGNQLPPAPAPPPPPAVPPAPPQGPLETYISRFCNPPLPQDLSTRVPGCTNPNHGIAILVRMKPFDPDEVNPNHKLRRRYQRALRRAMRPTDAQTALLVAAGVAPLGIPTSVAFDLIGSGHFGYGYDNAAEQALAAITLWFNHPVDGAARRAAIPTVKLLVPANPLEDPGRVRQAWLRAWYRYVQPTPPPPPPPPPPHLHALAAANNNFVGGANANLQVPVPLAPGAAPPAPPVPPPAGLPAHLLGIPNVIWPFDQPDPVLTPAQVSMGVRELRNRTIDNHRLHR